MQTTNNPAQDGSVTMEAVTTVATGNNSLGGPTEKNDSGILDDFSGLWPILVAVVLVVLLAVVILIIILRRRKAKRKKGGYHGC